MTSIFRLLCLLFGVVALTMITPGGARAEMPDDVQKKIASLSDAHREMFAGGQFDKLDAAMNGIQQGYEKGQWTDVEVAWLFSGPFGATDPSFEDLYNKWVAAYPKSYAARYARGAYYLRLALRYTAMPDKTAEAKRTIAAALQDDTASLSMTPMPMLTYCQLMQLYALTHDNDKMKMIFEGAAKVDPRGVMARTQYMTLLGQSGTVDEMRALAGDLRKTGRDEEDLSAALKTYDARLFRDGRYEDLDRDMNQVQKDYEAGQITDQELEIRFDLFFATGAREEDSLSAWIKAYPASYAARQARCSYYLATALAERGENYVDKTSSHDMAGMEVYLKRASDDCKAAEPLAKKPVMAYKQLIYIAELYGSFAERKEMLDLANIVDPKNSVARVQYMFGLEPQWGGSMQMMEDFFTEANLAGVSARGLTRLNNFILGAMECDECNGTDAFAKVGTIITGF